VSSLARNTIFLTGAKFSSVAIYALFGFILPNFVEVGENGVYSLMSTLIFFAGMISTFGVPVVITRQVARDKSNAAQMYADGRLAMVVGTLLAAVGLGVFLVYESWGLEVEEQAERYLLFGIALLITFADAMGGLGDSMFQAHERMAKTAVIEILTGLIRAGGAMLALILLPVEHRVLGVFVMFLLGASFRGWLVPRLVRRDLLAGQALPGTNVLRALTLFQQAGFIAVFRMLRMLRNRIDILLMGVLYVSLVEGYEGPANVDAARGMYAQAMRVAIVFHTITMAFNTALFPRLAKMTDGKDQHDATRLLYGRAVRWQAFWAAPMAAGVFLYAHIVAGWFGEEYRFGVPELGVLYTTWQVLQVLLISVFFDCIGGPVGFLMISHPEMERKVPLLGGLVAACSVVLNIFLIPRYGILGAAWASTITAAVEFVAKMLIVGRMYGNPLPALARTVPYYGLTAAMIGLIVMVGLDENPLLGGLLGASFYTGATLLTRQVDPAVVTLLKRRLKRG
jgi:O-antigen/teichoic acid export membrane protein